MKIRIGFVSNSSSSSFTIRLEDLSGAQLQLIIDHYNAAKQFPNMQEEFELRESDAWDISVGNGVVKGWTIIDNFSMERFLREIGVPSEKIKWEDY